MAFAEINGVSLHYLASLPAGRPVVAFVNSLGTDFRIWNEVVDGLGPDIGFVLFDKRGHGLSASGEAPARIETYAADLIALLDYLELDRVHLCGLSIGGLIAQSIALDHPHRVERLVLCDTAAKIGDDEMWNARAAAALGPGIASFAGGVMEKWFTQAFHQERAADLAGYRTMLERQSPDGYAFACAALRDADFRSRIGSIDKPTLVVCGDQDGSTPPQLVRTLADGIPASRFELIADAAHIPCVEQPAVLTRLILQFLGET